VHQESRERERERERENINYLTEQVILKFWARGIGLNERRKWKEGLVDKCESCEECKRLLVFVYLAVAGDVVCSATAMVAEKKKVMGKKKEERVKGSEGEELKKKSRTK